MHSGQASRQPAQKRGRDVSYRAAGRADANYGRDAMGFRKGRPFRFETLMLFVMVLVRTIPSDSFL